MLLIYHLHVHVYTLYILWFCCLIVKYNNSTCMYMYMYMYTETVWAFVICSLYTSPLASELSYSASVNRYQFLNFSMIAFKFQNVYKIIMQTVNQFLRICQPTNEDTYMYTCTCIYLLRIRQRSQTLHPLLHVDQGFEYINLVHEPFTPWPFLSCLPQN